jgi:hypothetical protein
VDLFKEYVDVFAWKYEDLKTYDTTIIQHRIPLKPRTKPFRKKMRQVNPILLPIIEKEVKKLLDAKIIIPLRYSEWVANLVPVRKKNGEIRLCVAPVCSIFSQSSYMKYYMSYEQLLSMVKPLIEQGSLKTQFDF